MYDYHSLLWLYKFFFEEKLTFLFKTLTNNKYLYNIFVTGTKFT